MLHYCEAQSAFRRITLSLLGDPSMNTTEQALKECRDFTLRTGREYGIILANDTIALRAEGTENEVAFDHERLLLLHWSGVTPTVCHSHPDDSPFSPQDLAMARPLGARAGLITPDGSTFRFESSRIGNPAGGDYILSSIYNHLLQSGHYDRYTWNEGLARKAAILLFNRNCASRGYIEGYVESLGPNLAVESDYLARWFTPEGRTHE